MKRLTLGLSLIAALTACGDKDTGDTADTSDSADTGDTGDTGALTPAPDVGTLVNEGGCSDVAMTKISADDTLALLVVSDTELAAQAYADGGAPITVTYDLAAGQGRVELWQGLGMNNLLCNDYLEGHEVVDTTWVGTSGTVELTVTPTGTATDWDWPATGEVTLTGVVLEAAGAESVTLPTTSWTANVGWLPG